MNFQQLTDEKLVTLYLESDPDAFLELLARYLPAIRYRVRRYSPVGLDYDDLVQEGLLGLLLAARTYRPDRETQFKTYSAACINNRIASAIKSGLRGNPLRDFVPIEEKEDITAFDTIPEDIIITQENLSFSLKQINSLLSRFEQQVLKMYLSGHTYSEIASTLHSTTKAVDNALQRVRRKLRPVRD